MSLYLMGLGDFRVVANSCKNEQKITEVGKKLAKSCKNERFLIKYGKRLDGQRSFGEGSFHHGNKACL
jgi:hypothetical protein